MTIVPAVREEINELLLDDTPEGKRKLDEALDALGRELAIPESMSELHPMGRPGISYKELMMKEFPPLRWNVKGFLVVGLGIIGGKPKKAKKSWFGLQLAHAVASGEEFLGFETVPGPVLLLALEDSDRRIKRRLEKQGALLGDLPIDFEFYWPPLDEGGFEKLAKRIEAGGRHGAYSLVILDTLASAKTGRLDENKAGDMAELILPLQHLSQKFGLGILLISHHRKGATDDVVWDIRGSGAIGAAVDTLIGLYPERGGDCSLLTISRDAPQLDLKIHFDPETCTWHKLGGLEALARTEAQTELLEALAQLGGEADIKSIASELGKNYKTVRYTAKLLEKRDVLQSRSEQTKGRPRVLYSVLEEEL